MLRTPWQRLSIRAALVLGLAVTLGLWIVTGYSFTRRITFVEREAAAVAARYVRAQDLLVTIRTQVPLSALRVRDALLNPDPAAIEEYRVQLESIRAVIIQALDDYEPVLDSRAGAERAQLAAMRDEVETFHRTSLDVLSQAGTRSPELIRDVLNRQIAPRREAAVKIAADIQSLNRLAFVQQQADISAIHRTAELQSWWQLGAALAVSLFVMMLVTIYSVRLEAQLRRQMERDAQLSRELQDATARLISAQEDERRTIARELHDEVGQVLTAIKVDLSIAQRAVEAHGLTVKPLDDAQTIADSALQTVRDIAQLLRPSALDDLGLPAAIDVSLRGLARRHEIAVELSQDGMSDRLDPDTEVAAYRIVQEALTNVARHARAAHCRVKLMRRPAALQLDIEDDGRGFDASASGSPTMGFGLIGMRERALRLGGTFQIESRPGMGTRLHIELPTEAASV